MRFSEPSGLYCIFKKLMVAVQYIIFHIYTKWRDSSSLSSKLYSPAMDFKCSDLEQWKEALSSYGDRIELLKKPNLVSFDDFYRNELPGVLRQRNPSYITTPELAKLMQWKLTRGKWRFLLLCSSSICQNIFILLSIIFKVY